MKNNFIDSILYKIDNSIKSTIEDNLKGSGYSTFEVVKLKDLKKDSVILNVLKETYESARFENNKLIFNLRYFYLPVINIRKYKSVYHVKYLFTNQEGKTEEIIGKFRESSNLIILKR